MNDDARCWEVCPAPTEPVAVLLENYYGQVVISQEGVIYKEDLVPGEWLRLKLPRDLHFGPLNDTTIIG